MIPPKLFHKKPNKKEKKKKDRKWKHSRNGNVWEVTSSKKGGRRKKISTRSLSLTTYKCRGANIKAEDVILVDCI